MARSSRGSEQSIRRATEQAPIAGKDSCCAVLCCTALVVLSRQRRKRAERAQAVVKRTNKRGDGPTDQDARLCKHGLSVGPWRFLQRAPKLTAMRSENFFQHSQKFISHTLIVLFICI
jgi:hypothetical protein